MKSKIQIKSVFGNLLFEFECNTVKEALIEAVKNGAGLRGANLSGANLRGANLSGANLSGANLSGANLRWADLSGANLSGANLSGANLRWANLRWANLSGADLRWANLSGASLSGANLSGADLRWANLSGANLSGANLRWADLRLANLRGANLSGANLSGADLSGAKNIPELQLSETIIVPEGDIIGWKKCKDNIIVKLLIPKEAKRSNATGRKCRAEYVEVLELIDRNDKRRKVDVGISQHDGKTEYRKGKTVKCDKWNEDRLEECAGGIHFFITRIEAENY